MSDPMRPNPAPAMPQGTPAPQGMGGMPPQPDIRQAMNEHLGPLVQAMALKHREHDGRLEQLENHMNTLMHLFSSAGKAKVAEGRMSALKGAYGKDLEGLDGFHKLTGSKGLTDHIVAAFDNHMQTHPEAKEEHIIEFAKPWIDGEKTRLGKYMKSESNEPSGEDKPVEAGTDVGKEKDESGTPKEEEKEGTGTAKGGDGIVGEKEQTEKHDGIDGMMDKLYKGKKKGESPSKKE